MNSSNSESTYIPVYTTMTVPDEAAISACQTGQQKTIDNLNKALDYCKIEIKNYNQLMEDISLKKTQAIKLSNNFSTASSLVSNANLNINLKGCENCVSSLTEQFDKMMSECDTKLTELMCIKEDIEMEITREIQKFNDCSNITKEVVVQIA